MTRAIIAIKNEDKTIQYVVCEKDGYLEETGRMLFNYYNTKDLIINLMSFGDIYVLGKTTEKPKVVKKYGINWLYNDSFENLDIISKRMFKADYRLKLGSIFKKRDYNDSLSQIKHIDKIKNLNDTIKFIDWIYIFDLKKDAWYYTQFSKADNKLLPIKKLTKNNTKYIT